MISDKKRTKWVTYKNGDWYLVPGSEFPEKKYPSSACPDQPLSQTQPKDLKKMNSNKDYYGMCLLLSVALGVSLAMNLILGIILKLII